jgi:GLPGLI family protein
LVKNIRLFQTMYRICWKKLKGLRIKHFWYAFLLAILLFNCKRHEPSGIYEKGRIDYKITYLENNLQHISPNLLPKKMKLEFNQEFSVNVIEGFMGVFKLHNITYFKHKRCSTLLEVINKNYIHFGKRGDDMCCFENMTDMEIEYTGETRNIAGLNCQKAIIRLTDDNESFEVYYTNDIKLVNPNMTNPYKNIDGVLVEFQLSMSGLKMKFTAEKFESSINHALKELVLPKNSIEVTRDQMAHIINRLME